VGNSKTYTQADWEEDIQLAKDAHIDAFALNVANELPELTNSLNIAFSVAASKGFKLFFSYDYAGLGAFSKGAVVKLCDDFCSKPAYYRFNNKPLLSTFEGSDSAQEWNDIKARTKGFFVPDWSSQGAFGAIGKAGGAVDGLFNWAAWPWGNQDMNTYVDASYMLALNQSGGKPYMMPASPWFYTNLPTWDKNWVWRGDSLWFDRWNQIIYNEPEFVEIISWNDFGESHHIGPLVDKAMEAFQYGKAPFNYGANYPHDGFRAFLPFVIDTYKNGVATITKEGVVGWWRRSATASCGDGGTSGNTATQLQLEFAPGQVSQDKIFFSALLGSPADVSVTIGGATVLASWTTKPDGGIGIYHGTADFSTSHKGDVVITVRRGNSEVAAVKPGSKGSIGPGSCVNGLTNWNAFVDVAWAPGSISATPALKRNQQGCIKGTGTGNFKGLCEFNCHYNCTSAPPSPNPKPSLTNFENRLPYIRLHLHATRKDRPRAPTAVRPRIPSRRPRRELQRPLRRRRPPRLLPPRRLLQDQAAPRGPHRVTLFAPRLHQGRCHQRGRAHGAVLVRLQLRLLPARRVQVHGAGTAESPARAEWVEGEAEGGA